MKWYPGLSKAVYNKEFAREVIKAYVLRKRTGTFKGSKFKVSEHIKGVREDLKKGCYRIETKKGCGV